MIRTKFVLYGLLFLRIYMHACIYIRIIIIISIMKTSILKINIEKLFLVITELSVLTNKIPCPTTQIITVIVIGKWANNKKKSLKPFLNNSIKLLAYRKKRVKSFFYIFLLLFLLINLIL